MRHSFKHDQMLHTRMAPTVPAVPTAAWTPVRILIAVGAAGPIVFLAVATLVGLLDPSYDIRTRTVSELAVGPHGWLQTANFFAFGLALVAFAASLYGGLRRGSIAGMLLLVVAGLGIFAAGIYPTDLQGAPETATGHIHNMLFLVIFFALILSYIFNALALRKVPGWRGHALYTALTAAAVFGLLLVFAIFAGDVGDPLHGVAGLIERVLIGVAMGWISLTGGRLLARGTAR